MRPHFEVLDTPAAWIDLLSYSDETARRRGIEAIHAIGAKFAAEYEQYRSITSNEGLDLLRRAYAARLTMTFLERIRDEFGKVGRTLDQWGALGPTRLMQFWESIPCLHVELELHTQMHLQRSKSWRENDDLDIAALSLAVPSCDAVVTEHFWADLIRRRGLDKRYVTRVAADLAELPHVLGCDHKAGQPSTN